MADETIRTTTFAVLDKDSVPCTEYGVGFLKGEIDEFFPDEAEKLAVAVMGKLANNPAALAAMLSNGECKYVIVRIGESIQIMDPECHSEFASGLRAAPDGATSWETAVQYMDEADPEA